MPVLFLLSSPKIGFSPRSGDTLPDKRRIWHGGADPPPCQISRLSGQKCGNTAPKTAQLLRNSQILYASIGSFYVCNVVTFGGKTTKL